MDLTLLIFSSSLEHSDVNIQKLVKKHIAESDILVLDILMIVDMFNLNKEIPDEMDHGTLQNSGQLKSSSGLCTISYFDVYTMPC